MNRPTMMMSLSLLAAVAAVAALLVGVSGHLPSAFAHPITVEGDAGDWTMTAPSQANLGHIGRNGSEEGEYIWKDASGDERGQAHTPDPTTDLVEFRVTADTSYLYFLAVMNDIQRTSGWDAPMIEIAIDTDRINGSGEDDFYEFATSTKVSPDAQWEVLVTTNFQDSKDALRVFTATASGTNWNAIYTGTEVISDAADTIEMAVPWTVLGFSGPPTSPLRFTVVVYVEGSTTWGPDDCITNYGNPGDTSSNTSVELSDGRVDYYFDLFFEADGDVYPPLRISEVLYDEPTSGVEWIEIYNGSPITISLTDHKVGDAETVDESSEGMERLTAGQIAPGETVVVANNGTYFTTTYGFFPDYEMTANEAAVPDTADYTTWATGNVLLSNTGDEVLLLDPSDTVLDVVTWGSGNWPSVTAHAANTGDGKSLERIPVSRDTDDCSEDFLVRSSPTPAYAGPDLEVAKTGPSQIVPWQRQVTYTIAYSNTGAAYAHAVVLTDTLPSGTAYVTDTSGLPCPACTPGTGGPLTWTIGVLSPTARHTFTLVVRTVSTPSLDTILTNTVRITTTDAEAETTDDTAAWYTAVVAVILSVDKEGSEYGIIGRTIGYTITVRNQGNLTATDTVLTDALPAQTSLLTQTNTCGLPCPACVPGATGVLTWSIGAMAAHTTCRVNLTVTVPSTVPWESRLVNHVAVATTSPTDDPADNTDALTTTVFPLLSIYDIQHVTDPSQDDRSPYESAVCWVEGVVVAGLGEIGSPGELFVIEEPGGGSWSGLMVYNDGVFSDVVEGDYVRVLGKVKEEDPGVFTGTTRLLFRGTHHALEVLSTSHPLPTPAVITPGALRDAATAEQWEGVLVEFQGTTAERPLSDGIWYVTDGTDSATAGTLGAEDGNLNYQAQVGDYYGFLRGIVWYEEEREYRLEPRRDADINLDYPVTFVYHDLEDVVYAGEPVYLAGEFNGWSTTALSLTANADSSVFSTTFTFDVTGTYQYRYVVSSGEDWRDWLNTLTRTVAVIRSFQTVNDYRDVVVDQARLQGPGAITVTLGQSTGNVFGRVHIQNVTDPSGEGRGIRAQVGYGTDPDPANWTWFPMRYNADDGGNDEFVGVMTPTAAGVYSYAVRFEGNWGPENPNAGWTYGDLDGGPFSLSRCGVLTVVVPDLTTSTKSSTLSGQRVNAGTPVTYTLLLTNTGGADAPVVVTDVLGAYYTVLDPLDFTPVFSDTLVWTGVVTAGEQVALHFVVQVVDVTDLPEGRAVLSNTAWVNDGFSPPFSIADLAPPWVQIERVYLPLTLRSYGP